MEKRENEITLKVLVDKDTFTKELINKGFTYIKSFSIDDFYYVPSILDTSENTRILLSKALLLRSFNIDGNKQTALCIKKKNIDVTGTILSQSAFNVRNVDINETKEFLNALDYKELMRIEEYDDVYSFEDLELAIKDVKNGPILIEVETNDKYKTIEELQTALNSLNLSLDYSDYFVKKAEIYLERLENENS